MKAKPWMMAGILAGVLGAGLEIGMAETGEKFLPPAQPSVTLYGTLKTPMRLEGSAVHLDVFTSDGLVWPVICRRPNLGVCANFLINPLPASLEVQGVLLQRSGTIEIAPVSLTRIYP